LLFPNFSVSFLSATYPLDITKTRLQVQGEHATRVASSKPHAYRGMFQTAIGIGKSYFVICMRV